MAVAASQKSLPRHIFNAAESGGWELMADAIFLGTNDEPIESVSRHVQGPALGLRARITEHTPAHQPAGFRAGDEDEERRRVRRLSESGLLLGHELRTCLNTVLISAEVLARPELYADLEVRGRQLGGIRSAVARAAELLLAAEASMSAPAALRQPPSSMVPLQTLFEDLRNELEGRAWASSVTLVFPKHLPRWSVDGGVARLVLSNLLVNAIKYADAAKDVRWVTVRVGLAEGDDPAVLAMEVSDNGLGIPAELQQHVLRRGFRAHPQVAEGTGLGLALTREHLARQGGSIQLVSEEGVGTTVRITLRALPLHGASPGR